LSYLSSCCCRRSGRCKDPRAPANPHFQPVVVRHALQTPFCDLSFFLFLLVWLPDNIIPFADYTILYGSCERSKQRATAREALPLLLYTLSLKYYFLEKTQIQHLNLTRYNTKQRRHHDHCTSVCYLSTFFNELFGVLSFMYSNVIQKERKQTKCLHVQ
jgi:hypothetical protein